MDQNAQEKTIDIGCPGGTASVYHAGPDERGMNVGHIAQHRAWAIRVLGGGIGAVAIGGVVITVVQKGIEAVKIEYVLVASTLLLVWAWIWSTEKELGLISYWLDPQDYEPPNDFIEASAIVLTGVFLAGLVLTCTRIEWYACLFALHTVVNLLASACMLAEIADAMSKGKLHLCEIRTITASDNKVEQGRLAACAEAIEILSRYYFPGRSDIVKPVGKEDTVMVRIRRIARILIDLRSWQICRMYLVLCSTIGVLILATVPRFQGARVVAYLLMSLTIVCSEAWIAYHRMRRDKALRRVKQACKA